MNLTEALDAALPYIPRTPPARGRPPRLDPNLSVREDVLDGQPIVGVFQRDGSNYYRFPPEQWNLLLLFDGERSYDEIAQAYEAQSGQSIAAADLRLFAEQMEEAKFWYKSPQEKNLALSQKVTAQRGRRAQQRSRINLAHISFSAWDPDRYLGRLDRAIGRFLYSPWCIFASVFLILFELAVFVSRWSIVGPDIRLYYNFLDKGFWDMVQFWVLLLVVGFIHESAHGLTCKHFGGQVHSMGLMFLYLTPCFFVDVTEIWITASKIERIYTIFAGIWSEMVLCGLAMMVWLNTQPGQWLHDFAYQIVLLTGVAAVAINLNPLIKLDGYYCLTEMLGLPDLKERSTAFLSGWFQSRVLRLPVDTIVVPRRRAPLFIAYALLSGAYSYLLLFFVIRLSFNVFSHWLADLAIVPAGLLAFVLFRGRLQSLRNVAAQLWKTKILGGSFLRPVPLLALAAASAILFLPIWRDRENAWFVIEPAQTLTVHAAVPGRLEQVLVAEGQEVRAGQPLARMTSLLASSMRSSAAAEKGSAQFQAISAELEGQSIGAAAARQSASSRSSSLANEAAASLEMVSPADGVILTRQPESLLYRDVAAGQPLLDLARAGTPVVRVYIPAAALDRIDAGSEVALLLPGRFSPVRVRLGPIAGDAVALPDGLIPRQDYNGVKLPVFYGARIALPVSADQALFGMSGRARIFGERRSVAARICTVVANLFKAHIW